MVNPDTIEKLKGMYTEVPLPTKSEMARRLGVSRPTLYGYLKELGDSFREEVESRAKEEVSRGRFDLLAEVGKACRAMLEEIEKLKAMQVEGVNPKIASTIFKGYDSLYRYYTLLGELLGQLGPSEKSVEVDIRRDEKLSIIQGHLKIIEKYRDRLHEG